MSKLVDLNDLTEIKNVDKSGMLDLYLRIHESYKEATELSYRVDLPEALVKRRRSIDYVVVAGAGGSLIGGELLKDWLEETAFIPILTCDDYKLPSYVSRSSLVFVVSYSGETEETLSAFVGAIKKGCAVVAVTSGGHLEAFCRTLNVPCVIVPKGLPPRGALPYLFVPLTIFLERLNVIPSSSEELNEVVSVLKEISRANAPEVPLEENFTKALALKLNGTIPMIYGLKRYRSVAHRWKTQLNENAKIPCICESFLRLTHNEIVGWEAPRRLTKKFSVVFLRDLDEPPEVTRRVEATKAIVMKKANKVLEVYAQGKGLLSKMFSLVHIGDLVSIYLAIARGIDPKPTRAIDKIKLELSKLETIKRIEAEVERLTCKSINGGYLSYVKD